MAAPDAEEIKKELQDDLNEGMALLGKGKDGKPLDPEARMAFIMKLAKQLMACCFPQPPPRQGSQKPADEKEKAPEATTTEPGAENARPDKNKGRKLGAFKLPDDEIAEIFEPIRDELLEQIIKRTEKKPQGLEVLGYRKQTVFGTNYFTKVKLGIGRNTIHAKIYSPVEGTPVLQGISDIKDQDEELDYF